MRKVRDSCEQPCRAGVTHYHSTVSLGIKQTVLFCQNWQSETFNIRNCLLIPSVQWFSLAMTAVSTVQMSR